MIQRYQPIGEPIEGPINPMFTPDDNGRVCLWIDVEPLIKVSHQRKVVIDALLEELARYQTPCLDNVSFTEDK